MSGFVPIVSESYEIEISGAMLRANVGIDLSFDGEIVSLLYGSALVIDPAGTGISHSKCGSPSSYYIGVPIDTDWDTPRKLIHNVNQEAKPVHR